MILLEDIFSRMPHGVSIENIFLELLWPGAAYYLYIQMNEI
jgi:hypothetical protein